MNEHNGEEYYLYHNISQSIFRKHICLPSCAATKVTANVSTNAALRILIAATGSQRFLGSKQILLVKR